MKLSILIPTIPSRRTQVVKLLKKLEKQAEAYDDIEILCLYDNKKMSTGKKRNKLLQISEGTFVMFVDDDDDISDDFIPLIYDAIYESPADLITYNVRFTDGVTEDYICDYSTDRRPAHIHVWRREKVIAHQFPDIQTGEDIRWVKSVMPNIDNKRHIPKTLYHYKFNLNKTETQR